MSTPMQFGVQLIFQSFGYPAEMTDGQVIAEEIQLALLAEELGFDSLWPVEHHCNDYASTAATPPGSARFTAPSRPR